MPRRPSVYLEYFTLAVLKVGVTRLPRCSCNESHWEIIWQNSIVQTLAERCFKKETIWLVVAAVFNTARGGTVENLLLLSAFRQKYLSSGYLVSSAVSPVNADIVELSPPLADCPASLGESCIVLPFEPFLED